MWLGWLAAQLKKIVTFQLRDIFAQSFKNSLYVTTLLIIFPQTKFVMLTLRAFGVYRNSKNVMDQSRATKFLASRNSRHTSTTYPRKVDLSSPMIISCAPSMLIH